MKRIAPAIAIAAIAIGATAATASARPAPPEGNEGSTDVALAWIQYQHSVATPANKAPAKKSTKPKKKTATGHGPGWIIYPGHD